MSIPTNSSPLQGGAPMQGVQGTSASNKQESKPEALINHTDSVVSTIGQDTLHVGTGSLSKIRDSISLNEFPFFQGDDYSFDEGEVKNMASQCHDSSRTEVAVKAQFAPKNSFLNELKEKQKALESKIEKEENFIVKLRGYATKRIENDTTKNEDFITVGNSEKQLKNDKEELASIKKEIKLREESSPDDSEENFDEYLQDIKNDLANASSSERPRDTEKTAGQNTAPVRKDSKPLPEIPPEKAARKIMDEYKTTSEHLKKELSETQERAPPRPDHPAPFNFKHVSDESQAYNEKDLMADFDEKRLTEAPKKKSLDQTISRAINKRDVQMRAAIDTRKTAFDNRSEIKEANKQLENLKEKFDRNKQTGDSNAAIQEHLKPINISQKRGDLEVILKKEMALEELKGKAKADENFTYYEKVRGALAEKAKHPKNSERQVELDKEIKENIKNATTFLTERANANRNDKYLRELLIYYSEMNS